MDGLHVYHVRSDGSSLRTIMCAGWKDGRGRKEGKPGLPPITHVANLQLQEWFAHAKHRAVHVDQSAAEADIIAIVFVDDLNQLYGISFEEGLSLRYETLQVSCMHAFACMQVCMARGCMHTPACIHPPPPPPPRDMHTPVVCAIPPIQCPFLKHFIRHAKVSATAAASHMARTFAFKRPRYSASSL